MKKNSLLAIDHHHFEEIDSTNNWAKAHCHTFDTSRLTLVSADHQTAGRGRFKRVWVSPRGENVMATFCFFAPAAREDIGNIPQVLALAALDVIHEYQLFPYLKWPNDVLVNGKKIAGILCETVSVDQKRCVILGIGLNVNLSKESADLIDRPATSLKIEKMKSYSVKIVLEQLQNRFAALLEVFLNGGFQPFLDRYRQNQGMQRGDLVSFHDNRAVHEGYFEKINEDGSLSLQLKDGSIQIFYAGEFI